MAKYETVPKTIEARKIVSIDWGPRGVKAAITLEDGSQVEPTIETLGKAFGWPLVGDYWAIDENGQAAIISKFRLEAVYRKVE